MKAQNVVIRTDRQTGATELVSLEYAVKMMNVLWKDAEELLLTGHSLNHGHIRYELQKETTDTSKVKKEIRQMYKQYVSRYGNGSKKTQIRSWWEYIADKDKALVSEVITEMSAVEKRLASYLESPLYLNKIRKYANYIMWSDVEAFEVIKVVSAKCVEIRRMKATIVKRPSDFEVGGFVGHYHDNHSQEWSFESDESQETMRIRLTKKGWKNGRHMKFQMSDSPREFYDFNF